MSNTEEITRYEYDEAGREVKQVNIGRNGDVQTATMTYDEAGRLTERRVITETS